MLSVKATGFGPLLKEIEGDIAKAVTGGIAEATEGLKQELRDQVRSVGLGNRVANAWRGQVFPRKSESIEAAGLVWSRAPNIVEAYDKGTTVRGRGGRRYLWLPTKSVPLVPTGGKDVRRRRATPPEVEARFGKLIILKGRGRTLMAFVEKQRGRTAKGALRKVRKGRRASGDDRELVLMFNLVPTRTFPKALDVKGAADRWAARVPGLIERRLTEYSNRGN